MLKNKWLICASVIACILAYYGDDDDPDFAKGTTQPTTCSLTADASDPGRATLSVAEAEQQCSAIRNAQRHRHG